MTVVVGCSGADQKVLLAGRVIDENQAAVQGAEVRLAADGSRTEEVRTSTGPAGNFTIRLPRAGRYLVTVTRSGFFTVDRRSLEIAPGGQQVEIVLNHLREVFSSISVHETTKGVDVDKTDAQKTLTNMDILNLPYQGRDISNALTLMPGVVKDQLGSVHLSGSSLNQVLFTLDSFNITDPVQGTFNTRMNIDNVRSIDFASARYSPEFGKGSAGTVAIATRMGSDVFRYDATNFVPGIDTLEGWHIGTWSPRFELSGPIVKKKVWFSESGEAVYSQDVVADVQGPNRTSVLELDNLLRSQVNLTPTDQVFVSFLMNSSDAPRSGLTALDPMSTTVDRRSRTWFVSAKQVKYLRSGAVLEWGYAEDRTFSRQIPQGGGFYQITPFGRNGNYFLDSTAVGGRKQALVNYSPRAFHFLGTHQLKAGVDVDGLSYEADNRRTGYQLWGLNGTQLNSVSFAGSGVFAEHSGEASSYLLDSWKPRSNVTVQAGIREDWDELLRNVMVSPRFSAAWSPFKGNGTKLSGGYAITRDATSLELFSRPLDQVSVTYNYAADGSIASGPAYTYFTIGKRPFASPIYRNWTAGVEQRLPRDMILSGNYTRKRGQNGLTYLALTGIQDPSINAIFNLTNFRLDVFDSAGVTLRQSFGKQYEWMVSYTRSRALSNSVLDLSVDQPLWAANNVGRMPWDSPNHIQAWGHLPTPLKDWSFAYLLEERDGFPFSVVTDYGAIVGDVNSRRFPRYFDLDLALERRLRLGKRYVALRAGYTNITNHRNPQVVNDVLGAPGFLDFYGSQGRHLVFRLRWLGAVE